MIKVQRLVPDIYYKESRDFQLFGRLYESIFNYIKTNIDLINKPLSKDLSLLYLNTLGFFPKRSYNNELLTGLCKSYSNIIRNKGTVKGVELTLISILKAANVTIPASEELYNIEVDNETSSLTIYLNDNVNSSEVCLIEEVLDYILPIGCSVDIKSTKSFSDVYILSVTSETSWNNSSVDNSQTSRIASTASISTTSLSGTAGYNVPDAYQGNQALGTIRKD